METKEIQEGLAKLDGEFMRPEITGRTEWWEVDGDSGIRWYPCIYVSETEAREADPGKIWTVEKTTGFGARLSAPGYLDCTEWTVFDTQQEAEEFLVETYCE